VPTTTAITGCKLPSVPVIYTPHSNLKKTQGMDVGQVGFKNDKLVRTTSLLAHSSCVCARNDCQV
jgi:hypothetical protein